MRMPEQHVPRDRLGMNPAGKRNAELAPWNPAAVLQEAVAHALLVAMAWYVGFGYLGVILVFVAELLLVSLLSTLMFPERGLWRHLRDLLKMTALLLFLLAFVFVTYGVAVEGDSGEAGMAGVRALSGVDRVQMLWGLGFSAAHLSAMLLYARSRPQPRKEWARLALMQNAATFVALFCLIFVVAFLGPFIVGAVRLVAPEVAGDSVLVLLAALVRFGFALLVSRMPDKDLDEVAAKPYVD